VINPQRILIIRPSALGDVARSVPVLVSLRAAFPDARIDWLVQDSFVDVIRAHPALTEAIAFPRNEFSRMVRQLRLPSLVGYLSTLRDRQYDVVLDCQGLLRSGVLAWSTRAPIRLGHADARELGWLGLTRRVPSSNRSHTVDRMLTLVEALGIRTHRDAEAMRLYTPKESTEFSRIKGLSPHRYILLAPTSRWPGKQWPAIKFASLASTLADEGKTIVIVGSRAEAASIQPLLELATKHSCIRSFVGDTNLAELMNLIEHSSLVVANDSAALHIAVGFHRPTVALFGPTRIDHVGPYQRDDDVIQHLRPDDRFNHKDTASGQSMMDRISVAEVLDAVRAKVTAGS
jgi:lipopolysaccharide heptosyltransferase I